MPSEYLGVPLGETRTKHLSRRLLKRRRIKVWRCQINHGQATPWCKPGVGDIDHARPWIGGELTQHKRHDDESRGRSFRTGIECARMQVGAEPVCDQSAARTFKSIFAWVVGTRLTARREQHCPESSSRAELHDATGKRECIKPEHRAVKFTLPRCTAEWPTIVGGSIEIPRLKFIRVLRRWQESESNWNATLTNLRSINRHGSVRGRCKRNPDGRLRTLSATSQSLFQLRT